MGESEQLFTSWPGDLPSLLTTRKTADASDQGCRKRYNAEHDPLVVPL